MSLVPDLSPHASGFDDVSHAVDLPKSIDDKQAPVDSDEVRVRLQSLFGPLYKDVTLSEEEDRAFLEFFATYRPPTEDKRSKKTWRTWDKEYVDLTLFDGTRFFIKKTEMSDEEFAQQCIIPGMASPRSRLYNERRAMEYVQANHSVPVLQPYGDPKDPEVGRLQTDWVDGIVAQHLELPEDRAEVARELVSYADELEEDTSESVKSFAPQLCLPPYAHNHAADIVALYNAPSPFSAQAFPLCHGDLTTNNVICYKDRPRVMYIIDWEYAGYYPSWCQAVVGSKTGNRTGAGLVPVKPWEIPSTFTADVALRALHDDAPENSAGPARSDKIARALGVTTTILS